MTRTATVHAPSAQLAVSRAGDGDAVPILFVHADLGNRRQWQGAVDRLSATRPVVSFDRRGHGESSVPTDGRYGYEHESADIAAVAGWAGFDRFVLIAHSGGAAAAFLYAERHPERVAGLFLLDPALAAEAMPAEQRSGAIEQTRAHPQDAAQQYYRSIAGNDPAVIEQVMADVKGTPDATIVGMIKALGRFDPAGVARRYSGPALAVVQSVNDTPFAIHQIAGFPHDVVDGGGHWIQLALPEHVNLRIDSFLDQVE